MKDLNGNSMHMFHDRVIELINNFPEELNDSRVTLIIHDDKYNKFDLESFSTRLKERRSKMVFRHVHLIGTEWNQQPFSGGLHYLMHRTKELTLRGCTVNLSLAKTEATTHLEHLSLSNSNLEMPSLQDPSRNPIKLKSLRLTGFSNIPSTFRNLSQLEKLESLYVDKIPHFMTNFLAKHG